jgi:hypothetical protein
MAGQAGRVARLEVSFHGSPRRGTQSLRRPHRPHFRFPFEIFYELTVDSITIYAVFHCSQDPQKWRKRLGY